MGHGGGTAEPAQAIMGVAAGSAGANDSAQAVAPAHAMGSEQPARFASRRSRATRSAQDMGSAQAVAGESHEVGARSWAGPDHKLGARHWPGTSQVGTYRVAGGEIAVWAGALHGAAASAQANWLPLSANSKEERSCEVPSRRTHADEKWGQVRAETATTAWITWITPTRQTADLWPSPMTKRPRPTSAGTLRQGSVAAPAVSVRHAVGVGGPGRMHADG